MVTDAGGIELFGNGGRPLADVDPGNGGNVKPPGNVGPPVDGNGGNVKPPGNVGKPLDVGNGGNVKPPGNVNCLATRLKLQEQTKDIKIRTLK